MTRSVFTRLTLLLALYLSSGAYAANPLTSTNKTTLSQSKQWLHLLHYHQVGLFSAWESQADDPNFFLAANGKTDPLEELNATISAFTAEQSTSQSMQCKFPARFAWLERNLNNTKFTRYDCPEYDEWAQKIDAEGLTMIFPAAYLNSPSSMFGHTLIRIDSRHRKNPLLDFTVNYAANADPEDNELVFSFKGLSGGYPGVFSILPYYQKVKEYSFLEARDVWEYQLDINNDELNQFLRHVWEVKDTHFDYYFFTENCSYHLLTLLDAASERFDFSDHFFSDVIPADTVRVLNQQGVIKEALFRPSTQSQMQNMTSQMSAEQQALAKAIVESPFDLKISDLKTTALSTALASQIDKSSDKAGDKNNDHDFDKNKAQVLELAYQYSRYLAVRKKQNAKALAKRSIAILSARSKLISDEAFAPIKTPEIRDDEGHRSHRIQSSFGREHEQNFVEFGLRMAYHDWLDTVAGYVQGAQLEIAHVKFRQYLEEPRHLQLEELRFIDIASMSPRDQFVTPLSWFVSTGLMRPKSQADELMPYLNGGAGFSYLFSSNRVSFLAKSEFDLDNDIQNGYRFAAGPRFVWMSQHPDWSSTFEWQRLYDVAGAKFELNEVKFGLSHALNRHWQIRVEAEYSETLSTYDNKSGYDTATKASFMYYF
mgnify:FL=1